MRAKQAANAMKISKVRSLIVVNGYLKVDMIPASAQIEGIMSPVKSCSSAETSFALIAVINIAIEKMQMLG
jgi:hypothetical protein